MLRLLATFASLSALLTAPGCVALRNQESWGTSRIPPSGVIGTAGLPQGWPPASESQREFDQGQVWSSVPIITGYLPGSDSPGSIDSVSIQTATPSTAPTPATTVRLYYGTNRTNVVAMAQPTTNSYGQCEVSIPARHEFGQLERPSFWRLDFRESAARHVALKKVEPLDGDACLARMRGDLATDDEPALFVFVHGYNVTFEQAARRTAQMAFDLQFRGVPLFYSWPSNGTLRGYTEDQKNADVSAAPLAEFLTRVATETGAKRIHLVAHSMGNRALVGALARLGQTPETPVKFNQVVFAAPDLDANQFANDIAPRIRPVVERVTIYSSGSDLALWASRLWNQTIRLGQPGPYWTRIRTYDWIDVIDATAVGFQWFELGHSAYGGPLLADLQRVMAGLPVTSPTSGPESGRWTVSRPVVPGRPSDGYDPAPIYLFRPVGPWPAAPVDPWW